MTRQEFIGRAAEQLRLDMGAQAAGMDPRRLYWLSERALDAVGAWGCRVTLETLKDLHRPTSSGAYCVLCDDMVEPDFPCSTHRAARLGLVL